MKVLIISIDKGLLGKGQLGDVVERHKKYGEFCDRLDIIVLSLRGFKNYQISDKVKSYPTNSNNKLNYFFDGLKLGERLFKENHYDLIICQDPFITGLIGRCLKGRFGGKLLIHFHGDFWNNKNWLGERWFNFLFLWLSKFVVPKADAIRVMSCGQKEKLISVGISENKIRIISTPVDLEKYKNIKIQEYKNKKTVLHVGRDDEVKDYDTLIKALKVVKEKIPETIFWQAGADKKIKEAMATKDFSDVELKGLVAADDLIGLYHQCDLAVLSSISESFGKVLVEANACAKPVVSTATTGAKEIIEDGKNGFLAPIGDAQKLAEKIIWLLEHPEDAKRMGGYGRELMKKKYGDNTDKIIKFWQDIINNNL
mgnify:CR=1 FL=1